MTLILASTSTARREMLTRAPDRPYLYDPLAKKFATGAGKRTP